MRPRDPDDGSRDTGGLQVLRPAWKAQQDSVSKRLVNSETTNAYVTSVTPLSFFFFVALTQSLVQNTD